MKIVTLLAALQAAAIMASVSVSGAQAPGGPEVPATTRTVNLSMEQRHVIKELLADLKVERSAVEVKLSAGDAVPPKAELQPIPQLIGQKVPQIKSHRFFVTSQQVVLVEPNQNKVADVIE